MSEAEKKNILKEIDKKVDQLPEKELAWLDGYVSGVIRASAEAKEEKEGA